MLKILYAGCLGLSLAILAQFTLKMCVAARNHEKLTKFLILEVQSRSRLSVLMKLKSQWPVLVMISNMYVPIYNSCFHTRRANSGKITCCKGVLLFDALVRGEPPHPGARYFVVIH